MNKFCNLVRYWLHYIIAPEKEISSGLLYSSPVLLYSAYSEQKQVFEILYIKFI